MIDPHARPVLGDADLILRAPVAGDAAARLALGRQPEIVRMFGGDPAAVQPLTLAMAEDWVEAQLKEPLAFVIEHAGRMIGAARLHSLNMQDKRASVAIGILDPALIGHGIGTRAMGLLLDHGFGTLKLHRIGLRVLDYNARAIAAYSKLGFKFEGREREAARVGEVYYDDVIMGLLASEWRR